MLAEAASKLKVGVGPSDAPPAPILASMPFYTSPCGYLRQKGVVGATASKDKDTCSDLVFKRKKGVDAAVSAQSTSTGRTSSFRENPPSASFPRDLVVHEGLSLIHI